MGHRQRALLTYVRFTRYVLQLGPSNLAAYPGYSYLGFVYLQTPAVFYLLGALSFFFHLDLLAHVRADPAPIQFPVGLQNIATLNAAPGFAEISVMMDETFDGLASWLALYLLPDTQVHVISRRNVPHEELSYETISRERPLLRQNFGCEGVGHSETQEVPDVGCLLYAPPSVLLDTPYQFSQTYWPVSFTGLGAREPEGRWNTDGVVQLTLKADIKRVPLFEDAFVNLRVTPYLPPGATRQRLVLSWGKDRRADASLVAPATISRGDMRADRRWRRYSRKCRSRARPKVMLYKPAREGRSELDATVASVVVRRSLRPGPGDATMSSMTTLPRIVRRSSAISGWGVYADQIIEEDARIVEYKGELISQAEGWRREQRYLPRQRIWIFTVNDRLVRDAAVGGNIARYINHACNPNCYTDVIGRTIWILAARRIRKGEELTYDYNTEGVAGIRCLCRPRCGRTL